MLVKFSREERPELPKGHRPSVKNIGPGPSAKEEGPGEVVSRETIEDLAPSYAPWPAPWPPMPTPVRRGLKPRIEKARHARGVHARTLKKLMSRVYEMSR